MSHNRAGEFYSLLAVRFLALEAEEGGSRTAPTGIGNLVPLFARVANPPGILHFFWAFGRGREEWVWCKSGNYPVVSGKRVFDDGVNGV